MQRLKNILQQRNTIVIKIGTNLLADKVNGIQMERLAAIAKSVAHMRTLGKNVAIVTSGAIGAGVAALQLNERPKNYSGKTGNCGDRSAPAHGSL